LKFGNHAALIGEIMGLDADESGAPKAFIRSPYGSRRILDELVGEQLPRIC